MTLTQYFAKTEGRGILATADGTGKVDAAVYGRPHVIDERTVAFIMRDRLTHANTLSNPRAAYLFMEREGDGYKGIRLFLTKIHEEKNTERLFTLRRPSHNAIRETEEERGDLFLAIFRVDAVLPLTARGGNPLSAAA